MFFFAPFFFPLFFLKVPFGAWALVDCLSFQNRFAGEGLRWWSRAILFRRPGWQLWLQLCDVWPRQTTKKGWRTEVDIWRYLLIIGWSIWSGKLGEIYRNWSVIGAKVVFPERFHNSGSLLVEVTPSSGTIPWDIAALEVLQMKIWVSRRLTVIFPWNANSEQPPLQW